MSGHLPCTVSWRHIKLMGVLASISTNCIDVTAPSDSTAFEIARSNSRTRITTRVDASLASLVNQRPPYHHEDVFMGEESSKIAYNLDLDDNYRMISSRRRTSTTHFQQPPNIKRLQKQKRGDNNTIVSGMGRRIQHFFERNSISNLLWKGLLPMLWIANACTALQVLSSTRNVVSSLAAIVALLVGDHALSSRSRSKSNDDAKLLAIIHHFIRDSGLFETLMNVLLGLSLPALLWKYRSAASDFRQLGSHRIRIQYGEKAPKRQVIDLYMPSYNNNNNNNNEQNVNVKRGLIFFVHGGAWGSGRPWMYRLVAKPFLEKGLAVAIVGYRTYPKGDVVAQVDDLELAAAELVKRYPDLCLRQQSELGVTVVAHSSGAHISLMMFLGRLRERLAGGLDNEDNDVQRMRMDAFIGISGPYDIAKHYIFEASRGLEELSPMQPACGGKSKFYMNSPALQLNTLLRKCSRRETQMVNKYIPRLAFVHGTEDDTVPVTSSMEASKLLRTSGVAIKCDDLYVPGIGHAETILEVMFGGTVQKAIWNWIEQGKANYVVDTSSPPSLLVENFGESTLSTQSLLNLETS